MKIRVVLLLAAAMATFSATAQAALVAYEGFDTANAVNSDAIAAGVTGSGFSAYGATNFRYDIRDGLSYADSSGNTLDVAGKSAGFNVAAVGGTQNLQLSLSSTIANSGTTYMSFLFDVTAVDSFGALVGLQDSQVTDSANPNPSVEAAFRSSSSNFGIYAGNNVDNGNNGIDSRTGPSTGTGLFLVISELNMDTEVMTTWLNPIDLANVTGTASHTITDTATTGWDDMTSFILSSGGSDAATVDEIRIGSTLADVTPFTSSVPEPSSFALLGLCGLGMLKRRRR